MKAVYLVGIDGSNCSSRALTYAKERARDSNGKVVVAYVIEWSPFSFSTVEENAERHKRREEELARARSEVVGPVVECIEAEGLEVEGVVKHGHPAETLARLGKQLDATCIVVGRRGSSPLKAKIFGSVAGSLVQIADRTVSVVP